MDAGQILLKHGLLSSADLARVSDARTNGARLDQQAVEMGLVAEADALRAFGEETGLEFIDLDAAAVDLSLLLYPVYYCFVNGAIALLIYHRRVVKGVWTPPRSFPTPAA